MVFKTVYIQVCKNKFQVKLTFYSYIVYVSKIALLIVQCKQLPK